jgi:hypothetical protein
MVSPVDEAIATSEIAEDSNIVAEGHQDNQYGNWSGAAEGVVATTTDTAIGIIDEMLDIPTDVMPALKKAVTPRAILNGELLPIVLGVGVVTGLVSSAAVSIISATDAGYKVVSVVSSFVLGSALVYLGLGASSDFYKYALISSGAGLAGTGLRGLLSFIPGVGFGAETVTKRSPTGSGHVAPGQSNYQVDTSPFTIDPEMTRKDVTLAAEVMSGPGAEGNFGEGDVLPVNYGQGGVTAVEHDQSFSQATGSLQRRGSDAQNAFVESVMPKTTSYQPQAYYAEDTPTMIQKNAHYTAETKAGIQNVFNTYQAPATTARRGGSVLPKRMTKNANGTSISNEMKGTVGMGSVIGQ